MSSDTKRTRPEGWNPRRTLNLIQPLSNYFTPNWKLLFPQLPPPTEADAKVVQAALNAECPVNLLENDPMHIVRLAIIEFLYSHDNAKIAKLDKDKEGKLLAIRVEAGKRVKRRAPHRFVLVCAGNAYTGHIDQLRQVGTFDRTKYPWMTNSHGRLMDILLASAYEFHHAFTSIGGRHYSDPNMPLTKEGRKEGQWRGLFFENRHNKCYVSIHVLVV